MVYWVGVFIVSFIMVLLLLIGTAVALSLLENRRNEKDDK